MIGHHAPSAESAPLTFSSALFLLNYVVMGFGEMVKFNRLIIQLCQDLKVTH